jgi:hypothetical protein
MEGMGGTGGVCRAGEEKQGEEREQGGARAVHEEWLLSGDLNRSQPY